MKLSAIALLAVFLPACTTMPSGGEGIDVARVAPHIEQFQLAADAFLAADTNGDGWIAGWEVGGYANTVLAQLFAYMAEIPAPTGEEDDGTR